VIKDCFAHSQGWISGNSSAKIPQLTTSWCLISRTLQTEAFHDHGGCLLRAAINWSRSSLRTLALRYTMNWRPFTTIWIHSHPTAFCFLFLLLSVSWTIFKCASLVICLVAALATSQWTNSCLCSCCGPMIAVLDVPPANRLGLDLLPPGWGGSESMICWCGIEEDDDNEKKWEALRTI